MKSFNFSIKYLSTLIIFLYSISAIAQTVNHKQYLLLTNEAELNIMKADYRQALKQYKIAFGYNPDGFGRDYYNAALCAVRIKNFKTAFEYLQNLTELGVEADYFEENTEINVLKNTKKWNRFIKYSKNVNSEKNRFDTLLQAEFDDMLKIDQKIKRMPENRDTFASVVLSNTKRIIQIINEKGFPSEKMLGISSPLSGPFSMVLLMHYFQTIGNNKDTLQLSPVVEKAVADCKLDKALFFKIYATRNEKDNVRDNFGSSNILIVDTNIVYFNYTKQSIETFDKNRVRLNLETYKQSQMKGTFQIRNSYKLRPMQDSEKTTDYGREISSSYNRYFFQIGVGHFQSLTLSTRAMIEKYVKENQCR